jgi:hypothetical protein
MPFLPDDQSAAPAVPAPVAPIAPAPVAAAPPIATPPVAHVWDAPISFAPAPTPDTAVSTAAPVTAAPVTAAPIAKQSSFVPDPPAPWSIDWSKGGEVTLPQSLQDFGDLMGERASSGLLNAAAAWQNGADLATQKAKLDAANQRLGPKLSTLADTLGYYASPTNLLDVFPGGSAASGAINAGLKSKLEGDDWTTASEHAAVGGATGGVASTLSKVATAPKVLSNLTDYTLSGVGAGASHLIFGDTVVPGSSALAGYLTHNAVQPAVKWVEENAARLAPYARYVTPLLTGAGLAVPQMVQQLWKDGPPK